MNQSKWPEHIIFMIPLTQVNIENHCSEALTIMIDVKANFKNKYKNLDCETCSVEESTQHLFKCKKYQDLNGKIKGETIQEVLRNNSEIDIAIFL